MGTQMRVGFIGLGTMGSAMAQNILKHGYKVVGYDTNADALRSILGKGGAVAQTPRALASQSDVVITMLPEPSDVEEVLFGKEGVFVGLRRGSVFIDMSTGSPIVALRVASKLQAEGIAAIDCPVGRGQEEAKSGRLLLMAGGDPAVIQQVRPLLMCMGNELVYCGGAGMGQAMKLANNLLGMLLVQSTSEAITLGLKAGLSLETLISVMSRTMANNAALSNAFPAKAFKGDLEPGFKLRLGRKDLRLALELAGYLDVPIPLGATTLQNCSALIAMGRGDQDVGAILDAQAQLVGVRAQLVQAPQPSKP